jgi:hypothetical protein
MRQRIRICAEEGLMEDREVDFIFDIPIRVAQELVGFRHDEAVDRTFEVLRSAAGSKPKWKFW